ncbi:MAG: hypothetical protein KDC73_10760 [Ignavibacteriae bacterium]|nr:hypothetical protein [Ignavibacteriota bacterium]MCB9242505.1 hypothetical protein [Ignavibacteriales bacterium]
MGSLPDLSDLKDILKDIKLRTDSEIDAVVDANADINANVNGTLNLNTSMTGDINKPVSVLILGDEKKPVSAFIKGDPNNPVAFSMELMNLPRFTVQDIKDMMKVRLHLPMYQQACFKFLGHELFSICLGGEAQAITEPYVPNSHERCEVTCCEVDTTPFPGDNKEVKYKEAE